MCVCVCVCVCMYIHIYIWMKDLATQWHKPDENHRITPWVHPRKNISHANTSSLKTDTLAVATCTVAPPSH